MIHFQDVPDQLVAPVTAHDFYNPQTFTRKRCEISFVEVMFVASSPSLFKIFVGMGDSNTLESCFMTPYTEEHQKPSC